VQAFELDALDYLVKPIAFARFEKTIRKAREYWLSLSSGPSTPDAGEFLFIKSDHRTIRLPYSDIILIEGLNEYVKVHTRDRKIITLAALKELEATLPGKRFIRIHRSYIVSLEQIRSWSTSEVEMTGGLRLPIGRVYKENFLRQAGR
jgi:DNA-binding LytR/AlgR family response regulator